MGEVNKIWDKLIRSRFIRWAFHALKSVWLVLIKIWEARKNFELVMALICGAAGEVVVYLIVLSLNGFKLEFPTYIRFPHVIEVLSLVVSIPVSIFFGMTGYIIFQHAKLQERFGQNIQHLTEVNNILSREDKQPNKFLPYKTIVSNIFLGSRLSENVTALTQSYSANTGEFASIIQLFLGNLQNNYNSNVSIFATCTLTPKRFMESDLSAYRKKWEEFAMIFKGDEGQCPNFKRLILPDLKWDLPNKNTKSGEESRAERYNSWQNNLKAEISLAEAFIKWNHDHCFKLYKLESPYPQNYYGVDFNPHPVNDFMIIAENDGTKPIGYVVIGGWQNHAEQNKFFIKYETEPARLERYCEYFQYLLSASKQITQKSDLE